MVDTTSKPFPTYFYMNKKFELFIFQFKLSIFQKGSPTISWSLAIYDFAYINYPKKNSQCRTLNIQDRSSTFQFRLKMPDSIQAYPKWGILIYLVVPPNSRKVVICRSHLWTLIYLPKLVFENQSIYS